MHGPSCRLYKGDVKKQTFSVLLDAEGYRMVSCLPCVRNVSDESGGGGGGGGRGGGGGGGGGGGKLCCQTWQKRGASGFCKKFFWEGQLHDQPAEVLPGERESRATRLLTKYRRLVGLLLPGTCVHVLWWTFFGVHGLWHLYQTRYPMAITMVFGSLIAGMTSEGGGAVAFPVMTLVLNINPTIARDFSLMIQAFGMTCASISILIMRLQLEWWAVSMCSLGGAAGLVLGFHVIDPAMTPPQKKMFFVSIWFSFAFALFLLNRHHKRRTVRVIPAVTWWKAGVLLLTGFVGGVFTSFAGSGLDICSFSVLTLFFRVSEKVATPTSVVLMAGASVFGFYWRAIMMPGAGGPDPLAWEYLACCIPVVVIGAPLGAVLGSHFHRLVLAALVYLLDTVALIAAFVLIPQTPVLAGVSVAFIVAGFFFFSGMTWLGNKLLQNYLEGLDDNGRVGEEEVEGGGESKEEEEGQGSRDCEAPLPTVTVGTVKTNGCTNKGFEVSTENGVVSDGSSVHNESSYM